MKNGARDSGGTAVLAKVTEIESIIHVTLNITTISSEATSLGQPRGRSSTAEVVKGVVVSFGKASCRFATSATEAVRGRGVLTGQLASNAALGQAVRLSVPAPRGHVATVEAAACNVADSAAERHLEAELGSSNKSLATEIIEKWRT